jgi:hypothetical protein
MAYSRPDSYNVVRSEVPTTVVRSSYNFWLLVPFSTAEICGGKCLSTSSTLNMHGLHSSQFPRDSPSFMGPAKFSPDAKSSGFF